MEGFERYTAAIFWFFFTSINGFSLISRDSMTIKTCMAELEVLISVNDKLVNKEDFPLNNSSLSESQETQRRKLSFHDVFISFLAEGEENWQEKDSNRENRITLRIICRTKKGN